MKTRHYLICFDISKNRIRRKVVKELLNKGQRVQKSVFECVIPDNRYIEMKNKLDGLIDCTTDSIRYYQMCERCIGTVSVSGIGSYVDEEELIVL